MTEMRYQAAKVNGGWAVVDTERDGEQVTQTFPTEQDAKTAARYSNYADEDRQRAQKRQQDAWASHLYEMASDLEQMAEMIRSGEPQDPEEKFTFQAEAEVTISRIDTMKQDLTRLLAQMAQGTLLYEQIRQEG